jgi:uncharacterized repeat protein (TIGR03803 family)
VSSRYWAAAKFRIHAVKILKILSAIFCILMSGSVALHVHAAIVFTNLFSFNQTNGASPNAGLIQAKDGNFYGTTFSGGPASDGTNGTLFRITASGALSNLISFAGTNGAGPRAPLLQGPDGNFYGTTYNGGTNNAGTVFELTTNGTLSTLATLAFSENIGGYPIAGLVQGRDGNFYGTTAIGGTNGFGTIFKLTTNGVFSTLVSFDNTNGASPYAGLAQANDGSLYGTTYQGGTNGGYGTIFKLATNGAFASLASFSNTNGANPYAGLVQDSDGNFYGTTFYGGSNNDGTIFKFTTNGELTTLVSFANTNGANPQAGVIQATDGNFYGTTSGGGTYTNEAGLGYGTIFELSTNGTLTTLISFNATNGAFPKASLIQASDENFYGTTASGGTNGYGTIFRLSVIVPAPRFQMETKAGTTLTLTWSATVGENYQMLYKTNLTQAAWSNLNNSILATNPTMMTPDTIGPDHQRFYRILLLP